MEYFDKNIEDLNITKPLGLTIGNFDGVHLGHQQILKRLKIFSKKRNLFTGLLSFNPHPISYFKKDKGFLIDSSDTKLDLLNKIGLDFFISIKFDKNFSNYSYEDFEQKVLLKCINLKLLFSGLDFRYGKNRKGDINSLKKFSKKNNIDLLTFDDFLEVNSSNKISSSMIRNLIKEGNVLRANILLGRPFEVSGKVIKGDQRGRTIGIPTANILYNKNQVELSEGVYSVKVLLNNKQFEGISNYGMRPTFNKKTPLLETHLFNFNKNIYGQEIKVKFVAKIRDEIKFNNVEDLLKQIPLDISKAKEILNNGN
ncbi:MAG: hypothetical protein CMI90_00810 [Pelagibacteraceae bacterium]|nr:hypothetical protein [Pelagibacteraceae bacterium]|tara:strand:- start:1501 stop:2436 length:936 start_codon:yes stop_codon:yes gene_type:complete